MIEKYTNIYVLCPPYSITGGPEALHQITYYLNSIGKKCKLAYISYLINRRVFIPEPYMKYVEEYVLDDDIVDRDNTAIIIPESFSFLHNQYKKATVFIWWLSVDNGSIKNNFLRKIYVLFVSPYRYLRSISNNEYNYYKSLKRRLAIKPYSFKHEMNNVVHLCASYYAFDYVSRNSNNRIFKCIEPISKHFLTNYKTSIDQISLESRDDIILYNPQKSEHFIQEFKRLYPHYKFFPLKGLTQDRLIEKYMSSKLYVDFGPFPGAERIPKEAVLYGCVIITGQHGASGFHGDVPIPADYKFRDDEFEQISTKIDFILKNYKACYDDFNEYRRTVLELEENFVNDLKAIFN